MTSLQYKHVPLSDEEPAPEDAEDVLNTLSPTGPGLAPNTQSPRAILALLFSSYCAVYFCRANLSVISTILIEDGIYGMTDFKLGVLISAGTFTYGIGKLLSGATPIHRPVTRILTCMALTSVATYSFAVSPSYSILMASWLLSRLAQSSIWTNFIVVINESFPSTSRGAAIAVLSQSFLVGDAGAKLILGALAPHIDYRGVSLVGATFMLTMTVASSKLLQPIKVSYTSPSSTAAASRSLCQRLRALASMRSFWCIALANGGTCFVREVFRDWVPLLLVDLCGTSTSAAAMLSTVFPLVGALAVLVIGFWGDKLKARGPLLVLFLLLAIASLLALTALSLESLPLSLPLTLTLIAGASLLNGPYSVLTTCTLDCCGDAANVDLLPLFQGLQDGSGYLFAATSGILVGESLETRGWTEALLKIVGFACVALVACALYWKEERRRKVLDHAFEMVARA